MDRGGGTVTPQGPAIAPGLREACQCLLTRHRGPATFRELQAAALGVPTTSGRQDGDKPHLTEEGPRLGVGDAAEGHTAGEGQDPETRELPDPRDCAVLLPKSRCLQTHGQSPGLSTATDLVALEKPERQQERRGSHRGSAGRRPLEGLPGATECDLAPHQLQPDRCHGTCSEDGCI